MIAAWRTCVEPGCGVRFGLTPRQCHAGLRAQTRRCAACRLARHRLRQATWVREKRHADRRRKSAPSHATGIPNRFRDERTAA